MSPRRTRRGTIRETINESSTLSTSKILRKTRSRVTKSHAKGSEEDSDNPMDTNSVVINDSNATTSFLNDTSISTKKRKKKQEPENQNNSLPATIDESQTSRKKNSKHTKVKKQTKSNKSQVLNANSLISEDGSFSKIQAEEISQLQDLISEDEETEKKSLRKKIKFDNKNLSSAEKVCKTPEKKSQKSSKHDKGSGADITPKNSPFNVPFNPNRSIKTPRKSPENLGSPKTHSHDALKLLNVPRKLSIMDSPSSSENSLQEPKINDKSVESKSKKSKSPKSANKKKSISPTLLVRPTFSKTPKIVFRTPKSKSSKKSPKKSSTSEKVKKSPKKSSTSEKVKKSLNVSTSPRKSMKVLSPAKSAKSQNISPSKLIKKTLEVSLMNSTDSAKQDLINQSQNLSQINSSIESKKSLTSPLNSSKSKITPSQSKTISKISSSSKSKNSPKFILPLSSSKTPKIALVLKSKKSPLTSRKITPSKMKNSPVKLGKSISPSKVLKSPVETKKNTPLSKAKKSPDKAITIQSTSSKTSKSSKPSNLSKSEKILIKSPRKSDGNNTLLKNAELSPRVIVNKLSTTQLDTSTLRSKTKQPTINLIPVDHTPNKNISINKSKSPKSPKQAMSKLHTPASTNKAQINKSISRVRVSLKNSTPVDVLDKRLVNLIPSNTSTPRESKKRVLSNLSNNSVIFNGSPKLKSKAIKRLNNQSKSASNFQLLDDESEPSMNDSSLIHLSDVFDDAEPSEKNSTFEIDKSNVNTRRRSDRDSNISQTSNKNDTFEIKKNTSKNLKSGGDNTYELENPKTPAIRNKSTKKTLDGKETGRENEQEKKNVKVHFASPNIGNQVRSSTINRVGTPAHSIHQKRTPATVRTPTNKALVNKIERKRINSAMTPQSRTPSVSASKRRSISVSDTPSQNRKSIHDMQIASVNRLSKPKVSVNSEKKIAIKTPVAKKIPNFSEIHKKNFAKMESIVDLKKRVENRHVTLNTASSAKKVPGSGNNPTPVDSTNGSYNRFGFKLRKNEAINIISKKQINTADTREKKRENARSALKGVRMNRRFELQMKSRMQNT